MITIDKGPHPSGANPNRAAATKPTLDLIYRARNTPATQSITHHPTYEFRRRRKIARKTVINNWSDTCACQNEFVAPTQNISMQLAFFVVLRACCRGLSNVILAGLPSSLYRIMYIVPTSARLGLRSEKAHLTHLWGFYLSFAEPRFKNKASPHYATSKRITGARRIFLHAMPLRHRCARLGRRIF